MAKQIIIATHSDLAEALNIRCYSQVVPSQSMKELNFE